MKTVLITGGTGLVGKRLTSLLLEKGYQVTILSRNTDKLQKNGPVRYATWDVEKQTIDFDAIQSADYIIHLAGAGVVAKRWTDSYKKEILESRTKSSKLISDSLKNHSNKVKAVVSSSAIGWYGPDKTPVIPFTEDDEPAADFLGQTCVSWEESISHASESGARVCKLRTGIVLSHEGGALAEFIKPIRFGLAAILGNGSQKISWIHIDDLCRMFIYAMENESISGSYNAVAGTPVSNKDLTLTLAKAIKGKFFIPFYVPAFLLKLVLGGSSIEVLKSTTVSNAKIKAAGFTFLYPSVESAIGEIFRKKL